VTLPPLRAPAVRPLPLALRLDEAAGAVGLSRRTLERLIADGELVACRLGRSVVIEVKELERLLTRNRIG
jgi:excisionase family DNA binding protein